MLCDDVAHPQNLFEGCVERPHPLRRLIVGSSGSVWRSSNTMRAGFRENLDEDGRTRRPSRVFGSGMMAQASSSWNASSRVRRKDGSTISTNMPTVAISNARLIGRS